ncbi:hypothetical protein YC2023_045196 [Brassica napus]
METFPLSIRQSGIQYELTLIPPGSPTPLEVIQVDLRLFNLSDTFVSSDEVRDHHSRGPGNAGAFVDLNLHDRSVSGDAHSGDESPFLEFIAHWDSNPTTYIFDWMIHTLTEKLPIRSVAGRVADRPNKHSSSLEPKELYLGFYSLRACLYFRGSKLDESPVVPSIGVIEPPHPCRGFPTTFHLRNGIKAGASLKDESEQNPLSKRRSSQSRDWRSSRTRQTSYLSIVNGMRIQVEEDEL